MRAYKFLDPIWGLKDIAQKRVKVSTFADMNDPFELIGSQWSDRHIDEMLTAHCAESYGAMCLSKNCTDPLLWAHYADKHRGICLGFDIPDDATVNPIPYEGEREKLDAQLLPKAIFSGQIDNLQNHFIRKLVLKYKGWQYEDEVRLLKRLEKGLTFFHFDDDDFTLRQVILGLRCTITKKSILNKLRGYHHDVEVLKATLSSDEFRIIPQPI